MLSLPDFWTNRTKNSLRRPSDETHQGNRYEKYLRQIRKNAKAKKKVKCGKYTQERNYENKINADIRDDRKSKSEKKSTKSDWISMLIRERERERNAGEKRGWKGIDKHIDKDRQDIDRYRDK